jgi:AbrB family looped-hinge helix DNA binding protein
MAEATLSSKNQIVIPREAREALQLKPGDKLIVTAPGGKILILEKPNSYSKAILGRGRYPKDYLKKERQSWR